MALYFPHSHLKIALFSNERILGNSTGVYSGIVAGGNGDKSDTANIVGSYMICDRIVTNEISFLGQNFLARNCTY